MTASELWAVVVARWRWIAGVLLALVLVIGGKCYGDSQYTRGRDLARADIADSVGKVYEGRYAALRDSLNHELAAFRTEIAAANARAAEAETRATAAEAHARQVLTPQVIAQTPPQVLALLEEYRVSDSTVVASNRALRVIVDSALARETRHTIALTLADSAIAQKDRTIIDLRKTKDVPHGFWHTVGVVAKDVGLVAAGGGLVKLIIH